MVALVVESWMWFTLVALVAISRFASRRMTLGACKNYQLDEHVMLVVLAFYTTLIATINIVSTTSSNLLPPGFDVDSLSAADIRERAYGSKLILVVEQCQCVTVWGAKACLLIMYLRLTTLRKENVAIRVLAGYVAVGFVVMEVCYFGVWCRPFADYWAVPTPNIECSAATDHLIMNAVFNLSSDCIMLATALPMFLRLQMAWKKKGAIVAIFSLGIFVVLAAVLNKVYSFSEPFGSQWTYWYVRESSTALLVANLPFVWAFWRKITGTETVHGVSRHGSQSLEKNLNPGAKTPTWRKESGTTTMTPTSPAFPWDSTNAPETPTEDLEMNPTIFRPTSPTDLTLQHHHDLLRESSSPGASAATAPLPHFTHGNNTNYPTHPILSLSRPRDEDAAGFRRARMQRAHVRSPSRQLPGVEEQELELMRRASPHYSHREEGAWAAAAAESSFAALYPVVSRGSEKSPGSFL